MIYCRCMRPINSFKTDGVAFMEEEIVANLVSHCDFCGADHKVKVELDLEQVLNAAIKAGHYQRVGV